MARLRLNPRLAKKHRSYDIAEVASRFAVSRSTVQAWCKAGLSSVRTGGVILIYGDDLRPYLENRLASQRVKCPPGSIYCLKCRVPRRPVPGTLTVEPLRETTGNARGLCPECGTAMNRRVCLSKLTQAGFDGVSVRPR